MDTQPQSRADKPTPWYRQFWPWFLIALPLTAVIGGLVTIVIAVRTSDTLVTAVPLSTGSTPTRLESDAR